MATAAQSDELHVSKGGVIFRQGDSGNEMFVISEGRVRLTLGTGGHEKEVAIFGKGEFFGELSLTNDAPRSATAIAVEDSALLVIGLDVFRMMVQDDLDIVFRMMNKQGQRLSRTNAPIQDLTERLGRIRIATHCLQRLVGSRRQLPVTIDARQVATELDASPDAVDATFADLAQRGVGSLKDRQWSIEAPEHVDKLVEALCVYAQGQVA
jgi:CRP/FNR family cyclic AMP-dependent transcriptional regulator